ncbi:ribonuclease H-like domain-containing protein [Tanacetum coccineum]
MWGSSCYNDSGDIPGLDEFGILTELYNNLKVYEHELKGVSNSSSQNIAFLSTEVKGSTLKQSTADPAHIPKGYTQAVSSKAQTAPNCASHSRNEIIYAMEEIDIRWQVAMITARIRKFMRKTGRPIDLKPKNGINFYKSKIECFNCQKLGHFARECRFAKYQENRANGHQEKRIVAIEDSNTKALHEFDAEHVHFGQDGLGDFDWSNKADDTPVSLALMATNSEIRDLKLEQKQKELDQALKERDDFKVKLEKWTNASVLQNKVLNKQRYLSDKSCIGFGVESSSVDSDNSSGNTNSTEFLYSDFQKAKGFHAGSRDTRPVWNNIQRVNHSNFSGNSRYPHQRKSFIPSAVLTREGLKSTARPNLTRTVPSKSTANTFYQGTARPAVLSQSTGRPYYPRLDNIRLRTSSFSPSSRSSTTRTSYRPQRPKKIMKSIWVKKGSTIGSQAVLPQNVKESAMINSKQAWRPKGAYSDTGKPKKNIKDLIALIDMDASGSIHDKDKLSDFKAFKGGYVAFGNDSKGGKISRKGTIKTSCIDFEKVSYVEELKFNLLSVSQIFVLRRSRWTLRAPARKNNVYSLDLKNIIPSRGVTCLVAKATKDEAVL